MQNPGSRKFHCHRNRICGTSGYAKSTSKAPCQVIIHFGIYPLPCTKYAPFNALAAMQAGLYIRGRNIVRMGDQLTLPVSHQQLEIMTATGAAAAKRIQLMVRSIQAEMYQTFPVGDLQDRRRFIIRYSFTGCLFDESFTIVIQEEAYGNRLCTALVITPAYTIRQNDTFRFLDNAQYLLGRKNPLLIGQGRPDGNHS